MSHGGSHHISPNISWFLNDIPLQKTSNTRGGINIETEKSPFATISKLVIVRVDRRDEGKYSCGGITVYPDSVVLRVLPFRKLAIIFFLSFFQKNLFENSSHENLVTLQKWSTFYSCQLVNTLCHLDEKKLCSVFPFRKRKDTKNKRNVYLKKSTYWPYG